MQTPEGDHEPIKHLQYSQAKCCHCTYTQKGNTAFSIKQTALSSLVLQNADLLEHYMS